MEQVFTFGWFNTISFHISGAMCLSDIVLAKEPAIRQFCCSQGFRNGSIKLKSGLVSDNHVFIFIVFFE